jgi:hypothetical protein
MNKKILAQYSEYFTITGDAQAAASLVHSQAVASLDETVMSIYEDVKSQISKGIVKNLMARYLK